MTPVFIFSLPRSGSTLLQRKLSQHPKISTVPEPWILLPLLSMFRDEGVYADYGHTLFRRAMSDLESHLPAQSETIEHAIRDFALSIYSKASAPDANFFIDKTPRYHVVSDRIIQIFSQAKFIFLWRNPLSVVSSIVQTWGNGRWALYRYKLDLYKGLRALINSYRKHRDRSIAVRFEDLVTKDGRAWSKIYDYLDTDPSEVKTSGEIDAIEGEMGDPRQQQYRSLSAEPLHKWKKSLNNPVRKIWLRRYLSWIGREDLNMMGYDMDVLVEALNKNDNKISYIASDLAYTAANILHSIFDHYALKDKTKMNWTNIVAHN